MSEDQNTKASGNGRHTTGHTPAVETLSPGAEDNSEQAETTEITALKLLLQQFRGLGEYFLHYVAARTDSATLSLRTTFVRMTLGVLGFVSVAGLILIASWFVLNGIAVGLGELFGARFWLGSVVAGMLLLAGLTGGMYYALGRSARTARDRTVAKYEKRQARQQSRFGRRFADGAGITTSDK